MNQNESDPVIDEIRENRRRISQKFDHDPAQIVAYYIDLQKKYCDRLKGSTQSAETVAPFSQEQVEAGNHRR